MLFLQPGDSLFRKPEGPPILAYRAWLATYRLLCAMRPRKSTHEPSTQDENLARETEKTFAVQICWGCFVAEVHSG